MKSGWRRSTFESRKQQIRAELKKIGSGRDRLNWLLRRIRSEDSGDKASYQEKFICIVYALLTHLESGGLSQRSIEQLSDYANALLRIAGIDGNRVQLADLKKNLHDVLSQIHRQEGEAWKAMVEHTLSSRFESQSFSGSESASYRLTEGIGVLRLGQGSLAIDTLEEAIAMGLDQRGQLRARIEIARAKRLQGKYQECISVFEKEILPFKHSPFFGEYVWEKACSETSVSGDLSQLFSLTRPKRSHYQASYVIEAFLWSRAAPEKKWLLRFPRLGGRKLSRRLGFSKEANYLKAARLVESLYDEQVALDIRIQSLSALFSLARKLKTIDKEMLVWAAATRWLARKKLYPLTWICLSEYEAMSLKISDGTHSDALGIMGDLLTAAIASRNKTILPEKIQAGRKA